MALMKVKMLIKLFKDFAEDIHISLLDTHNLVGAKYKQLIVF